MAKERNLVCKHYMYEGACNIKNKKCHFWKEMQTCSIYDPLPGSKPNRVDRRRHKLEKIYQKERNDY